MDCGDITLPRLALGDEANQRWGGGVKGIQSGWASAFSAHRGKRSDLLPPYWKFGNTKPEGNLTSAFRKLSKLENIQKLNADCLCVTAPAFPIHKFISKHTNQSQKPETTITDHLRIAARFF